MITIDEAVIRQSIFHYVPADGSKIVFSNELFDFSTEDEEKLLKKLFLSPFLNAPVTFEFTHEVDIDFNVLFGLARSIHRRDEFLNKSKEISQHLASVYRHPKIRNSDVFLVKFEDVKVGSRYYEALGIYRFEEKETFIETSSDRGDIGLEFRKGLGSKKPEKACLIIFSEEPYTILVIDNNPNQTDYWQNDFIKLKPKDDDVNHTNNFLSLAKEYITGQISKDFDTTRAEQIDYLNKSVSYFKTHQQFDRDEFVGEVFDRDEIRGSFQKFDARYRADNELSVSDNFEISGQAVKKQAKIFKSVLKLDKNFHIYIHGDKEMIERGMDKDGRKFYKLYFEHES